MSEPTQGHVDIVFDGPPGHTCGRFVDAENEAGASISIGEWVHRDDGYYALRIPVSQALIAAAPELLAACKEALPLLQYYADTEPCAKSQQVLHAGIASLTRAKDKAEGGDDD